MFQNSTRVRDLIGYGLSRPGHVWPNGARLAASININYEEGAEYTVENGDPYNEKIGEVTSVVPEGRRDLGMEELFAYGTRAGLPRFLDCLDRHGFPATFLMCGRAIERTPNLARACIERGHEPVVHGWRWRTHVDYDDPVKEKAEIDKTRDVIRQVTGVEPVGFVCRGSQSLYTRRILSELGFLYDSNGWDDDLPYWHFDPQARPILVVPYALDTNDMKFYHPNGFAGPREFLDYLNSALDVLIGEAEAGKSSLLNIGLHLRICGRPGRFWAVEHFFQRLHNERDRIWIARRRDIAESWMKAFPVVEKRLET